MRKRPALRRTLPLLVVLLLALVPGRAAAAIVVNGNFESGTLNGWQVHQLTEAGNWFAYRGTEGPISRKLSGLPVQEPPQGTYAAIADEADPDTLVLYQEVTLPAGSSDQLSLLAYYTSHAPIAVPTPDTLSALEEDLAGQANQQFRIDVMRAGAPLESLNPADILLNVFQTAPGAEPVMEPRKLTADLTPFAGQTVMLRIAVAAHQETLNAGVDAVQITSTAAGSGPGGVAGPGGNAGSNGATGGHGAGRLALGRAKVNRRNGTVALPVQVPEAGVLRAHGAKLSGRRGRRRGGLSIRATGAPAAAAGTVVLHLAPSGPAWAELRQRGLLRTSVKVSFAPGGGGEGATASKKVVLRLAPRRFRR